MELSFGYFGESNSEVAIRDFVHRLKSVKLLENRNRTSSAAVCCWIKRILLRIRLQASVELAQKFAVQRTSRWFRLVLRTECKLKWQCKNVALTCVLASPDFAACAPSFAWWCSNNVQTSWCFSHIYSNRMHSCLGVCERTFGRTSTHLVCELFPVCEPDRKTKRIEGSGFAIIRKALSVIEPEFRCKTFISFAFTSTVRNVCTEADEHRERKKSTAKFEFSRSEWNCSNWIALDWLYLIVLCVLSTSFVQNNHKGEWK